MFISIHVRRSDFDKFVEIVGFGGKEEPCVGGYKIAHYIGEAEYEETIDIFGLLEQAAEAELVFYGDHDPAEEDSDLEAPFAGSFSAAGGSFVIVPSMPRGVPVIDVLPDGSVDAGQYQTAVEYFEVLKQAALLFNEEEVPGSSSWDLAEDQDQWSDKIAPDEFVIVQAPLLEEGSGECPGAPQEALVHFFVSESIKGIGVVARGPRSESAMFRAAHELRRRRLSELTWKGKGVLRRPE